MTMYTLDYLLSGFLTELFAPKESYMVNYKLQKNNEVTRENIPMSELTREKAYEIRESTKELKQYRSLVRLCSMNQDRQGKFHVIGSSCPGLTMNDLLDSCNGRERRVLEMRFGLEDGVERTRKDIASDFGVTRERIRQIEAKGMRKIFRVMVEFFTSQQTNSHMSVDLLDVSGGVLSPLKEAKIERVDQILELGLGRLLTLRNFGESRANTLGLALWEKGFKLDDEYVRFLNLIHKEGRTPRGAWYQICFPGSLAEPPSFRKKQKR